MWRCGYVEMWMRRCVRLRCVDVEVWRGVDVEMCRCGSVEMWMWRYVDVEMCRC